MKSLLFIILFITAISSIAQDTTKATKHIFKKNNLFDLGVSIGDKQVVGSLDWNHFHGVGKKQNLKLGYGIRYSGFHGIESKVYTTAPAKLTSGQEGPQVLFVDNIPNNIDTINVARNPYVGMANIFLSAQYTFFKKLDLGFNIDLVGFSFGGKTTGAYTVHSSAQPNVNDGSTQNLTPTAFNLLLVSDNDLGSLNSEFFLRYWINDKWAIKGVFTFIFTEYTTGSKLRFENDRFRNKGILFGLGVTYRPWK